MLTPDGPLAVPVSGEELVQPVDPHLRSFVAQRRRIDLAGIVGFSETGVDQMPMK